MTMLTRSLEIRTVPTKREFLGSRVQKLEADLEAQTDMDGLQSPTLIFALSEAIEALVKAESEAIK